VDTTSGLFSELNSLCEIICETRARQFICVSFSPHLTTILLLDVTEIYSSGTSLSKLGTGRRRKNVNRLQRALQMRGNRTLRQKEILSASDEHIPYIHMLLGT
jgi:hypothetical protein